MKSKTRWFIFLLIGMMVLSGTFIVYAQDDGHGDDHDEEYSEEEVAAGYQLFTELGCIACHGLNGEGTNTGPALPGHEPLEIRRQLRAPLGIMPVFSPDSVSSEDIELLIAYVTSLEGGHMHMEVDVVEQAVWFYHSLALSKIEEGDVDATIHYVEHIIGFVVGEHLTKMQQILAALQADAIEPATQMLTDMLADVPRPMDMEEPDAAQLHLQLAFASASAGLVDETIHHANHYMELTPDEHHEHLEEILAQFDSALQDAEHELGEILGDSGMMGDMMGDEHDDGDDHEDGDEHEGGDNHGDG